MSFEARSGSFAAGGTAFCYLYDSSCMRLFKKLAAINEEAGQKMRYQEGEPVTDIVPCQTVERELVRFLFFRLLKKHRMEVELPLPSISGS